MKKILLYAILLLSLVTFTGCKPQEHIDPRISQLRNDVIFGESQNFKLSAYCERREDPLESDGVCGKLENSLIFKIDFGKSQSAIENCSISFTLNGKEYCETFEYKPLSSFLFAHVCVENLPSEPIDVCIKGPNVNETLTLCSIKNKGTVDYFSALQTITNSNEDCKNFLESGDGELRIRLIDNDGYDYWYIGFISAEKTLSFLIDGENGEIIAQKNGA